MRRLAETRLPALAALVAVGLLLPQLLGESPYYLNIAVSVGMFAMPALGASLLMSCGLWSFGQGALASVGSYTAAILMVRAGVPFLLALGAGTLTAALAAALLAYPYLRASGVSFSILTLVTLLAVNEVITLTPGFSGGNQGLTGVPAPPELHLFGQTFELASPLGSYYAVAVLVLICLGVTVRLRAAPVHRMLQAAREAPELAGSLGVRVTLLRAGIFVLAAALTGLAGAFSASYLQVAAPEVWGLQPAIFIVAYAFIGGFGYAVGPILGAALVIGGASALPEGNNYQPIAIGVALIVVTVFAPRGISGIVEDAIGAVRAGFARVRARPLGPGPQRSNLVVEGGAAADPGGRKASPRPDAPRPTEQK